MYGVAQRIEHTGVVGGDGRVDLPDIRFRNLHIFREGAVGIDADDLHMLADVGFTGAALVTLAARHVHLR